MTNQSHTSGTRRSRDHSRLMSLREVSFASALSELLQTSAALKEAEESGAASGERGERLLAEVIRSAKKMTVEYEKYSASRLQLQFGDIDTAKTADPYMALSDHLAGGRKRRLTPMGEAEFEELARSKGWRTERRGWPTYLCTKETGEVVAVCISPLLESDRIKRLSTARSEVMTCFQKSGLKSFVFNGQEMIPFDTNEHSPARNQSGKLKSRPTESLATLRNRFKQSATKKGWSVFGTGWPDYACFSPESEMFVAEVKRRFANGSYEQLQPHQAQVMEALSRSGIPCYVTNGSHMERFSIDKHGWKTLES